MTVSNRQFYNDKFPSKAVLITSGFFVKERASFRTFTSKLRLHIFYSIVRLYYGGRNRQVLLPAHLNMIIMLWCTYNLSIQLVGWIQSARRHNATGFKFIELNSAFPWFTVVKSFSSWYALLLLFFLRFSSISLHCSPILFSFAFFVYLLMFSFTSLYFSDPSGSNHFFLSSLLLTSSLLPKTAVQKKSTWLGLSFWPY